MEKGAEKGFWEHITGSIASGTFKLTIDEFDPTDGTFTHLLLPIKSIMLSRSTCRSKSFINDDIAKKRRKAHV